MSELSKKKSWAAAFVSVFVMAAFGFVFANAWNKFAEATLYKYEKKDSLGRPIKPVKQTLYYALSVTAICAIMLWVLYEFTITH